MTVSPATDDSTMRAAAKAVVDKAPPLTGDQRTRLRALLTPVSSTPPRISKAA